MSNPRFKNDKNTGDFAPYYGFGAVAIGLLISICVLFPNSAMFLVVLLGYLVAAFGLLLLKNLDKRMKKRQISPTCVIKAASTADEAVSARRIR